MLKARGLREKDASGMSGSTLSPFTRKPAPVTFPYKQQFQRHQLSCFHLNLVSFPSIEGKGVEGDVAALLERIPFPLFSSSRRRCSSLYFCCRCWTLHDRKCSAEVALVYIFDNHYIKYTSVGKRRYKEKTWHIWSTNSKTYIISVSTKMPVRTSKFMKLAGCKN